MQPRFRAVGQTHAEWYTFVKPENKRQMYGTVSLPMPDCHIYWFFRCLPFIDEIQFMLISSHHICIRYSIDKSHYSDYYMYMYSIFVHIMDKHLFSSCQQALIYFCAVLCCADCCTVQCSAVPCYAVGNGMVCFFILVSCNS